MEIRDVKDQQQQKPKQKGIKENQGGTGKETDREDVKREPLTPPKVESATEMGMIHDMTPNSFSPKVWKKEQQ